MANIHSHAGTPETSATPNLPEITIVRDTKERVSYILEWSLPGTPNTRTDSSFGVTYSRTTDMDSLTPEQKESLVPLTGGTFDAVVESLENPDLAKFLVPGRKELTHTEQIVTSDFRIVDRAEAHLLAEEHICCHGLITCEIKGETYAIYVLEGKARVIAPFTTGGHLAVTPENKSTLESISSLGTDSESLKTRNRLMQELVFDNMCKEFWEETHLDIDPAKITHFLRNENDLTETHVQFDANYKGVKGNKEVVHLFHVHLSEEEIKAMIPDEKDGVNGFVLVKLNEVEQVLKDGSIHLLDLHGKPYHLKAGMKTVSKNQFNQEFIRVSPSYIPVFTELVNENLRNRGS